MVVKPEDRLSAEKALGHGFVEGFEPVYAYCYQEKLQDNLGAMAAAVSPQEEDFEPFHS